MQLLWTPPIRQRWNSLLTFAVHRLKPQPASLSQRDFFFRNHARNIVINDEQPLAGTMVRPQEAGPKQASERGSSVESVIEALCLKGVQPPDLARWRALEVTQPALPLFGCPGCDHPT